MAPPPRLHALSLLAAVLAVVVPLLSRAHPVGFNSTIGYASTAPASDANSPSNWTGAAYDAANLGGSGVNRNGGLDNGTTNDASTYVANNQPRQGQTFTTGSSANGYELTAITVRLAGYTANAATGTSSTYWDLGLKNGPVLVEVSKVSGTEATALSRQLFTFGGTGNPGAGSSANGSGTYLAFTLPFPVHLEPNTTYGFDLAIGNGSSNFFEWLGLSTAYAPDPYSGGTAFTRAAGGGPVTLLAGDRVFQAKLVPAASPYAPFSHPGALHTQADLDRMAAKVAANAQPWKASFDTLAASPYAQTSWSAYDIDYINRGGAAANNYTRSQQDAQAIYELALRWKLTGNTAYAARAVQIADVWSGLLGITGDTNASLASGICGYLFACGGELLSTYPGWSAAGKQAYKDMMMRVFYPANLDFLWRHHDTPVTKGGNTHYRLNWDTANMASMAAIGILCDNRAVYQQALDYFKFGPGNGRVERAAWYVFPEGLAQTEEITRDQGHNLGGWYAMALLCQMAWNQGDDLFGYDNNRVLRAFENNAKYNLGVEVACLPHRNTSLAYTEVLSPAGRGFGGYYQYELVHAHYANIKGIATPWSRLAVETIGAEPRPDTAIHPSQVDWFGLGSLTFARDAGPSVAPSGLAAQWSKNRVTLSWWGSANATGYEVKRAGAASGPYATLGTVTGRDLTFADTTAQNGATYHYLVTALTPSGNLDSAPLRVARELVTRYTFEGVANDVAGTRHATLQGGSTAPGYTTGFGGGQALNLNGANQYAQLPAGSANHQDLTIATWVYWNGGAAWQRIFDFGSEIEKNLFLTPSAGSNLRFSITSTRGAEAGTLNGPVLATGQWVHVAVTLNGPLGTLFVNGKPVDTQVIDSLDPLFGQPFCYLGRSQWNADPYFNGRLDDFRLYNRGLTGDEVYALWGQGGSNQAPAFGADPLDLPPATEDAAYDAPGRSLAAHAADANGGTLTFTKLAGPAWLSVASSGALSGTPTNADVGENTFMVRVTDGTGATDDTTLRIAVVNTGDAPVWSAPALTKSSVTRDQPYLAQSLAGDASDVDANAVLSFTKASGPAWLVVAPDGTLSGTPGAADVGANVFIVRVTDDSGLFSETTLTVTVLPFALRLQLSFENNLADDTGTFPATALGSPAYGTGRTGRGLVFDGVDDLVTLPAAVADSQDITIAAWVYWTGGAEFQRIFDFGNGTGDYLYLSPNTGGALRFAIKNGGSEQVLTAPVLATGQWVHVAVTLGGDTGTLYVNGAAVAANSALTLNPGDFKPATNYLGDSQWAADPLFSGRLDEVRIYNYALTGAEIAAFLDLVPAVPFNLVATPRTGRVDLSWDAAQGAQTYTVKRSLVAGGPYTTVASTVAGTTHADTGLVNGTTYFYVVSAANSRGASADSDQATAVPSDLVVRLRFDEGAGITAADASGNAWNATLVNAPAWTTGQLGAAVNLPASASQHLTLPAGVVSGLTDFTIAAWVKVNAFGTWQRVFDFGSGTTNYMFLTTQYSATSPNNARVRFAIRAPSVAEQSISSSVALAAGVWSHVVVTRIGTTVRLYQNGTQTVSGLLTSSPASLGTTTQNYLGRSQFPADPYLNAALDDFRIYSRGLDAAEVAQLAAPLATPSGFTATPAPLAINLSWTAVPNATRYALYTATTSGGPYAPLASSLQSTNWTHADLGFGAARYYTLVASNAFYESSAAAEITASPEPALIVEEETLTPAFGPAADGTPAMLEFTTTTSVLGHVYQIQSTADLMAGVWTNVGPATSGTGAPLVIPVPEESVSPARFYRLQVTR